MAQSNTDIVRGAFEAYRAQDRDAAEPLYSPDFVFTSPQDDHIDREAFFERCFPTATRLRDQEILQLHGQARSLRHVRVRPARRRSPP